MWWSRVKLYNQWCIQTTEWLLTAAHTQLTAARLPTANTCISRLTQELFQWMNSYIILEFFARMLFPLNFQHGPFFPHETENWKTLQRKNQLLENSHYNHAHKTCALTNWHRWHVIFAIWFILAATKSFFTDFCYYTHLLLHHSHRNLCNQCELGQLLAAEMLLLQELASAVHRATLWHPLYVRHLQVVNIPFYTLF